MNVRSEESGKDKEMITKSKYMQFIKCAKCFRLAEADPKAGENSLIDPNLIRQGQATGETARGYFGKYSQINFASRECMAVQTEIFMNDPDILNIAEASFIHDDCFCSADILHKTDTGCEIYEVKATTEMQDEYIDDLAFQYLVISSVLPNVTRACVMYLNKEYVRQGALDLQQLFVIEDITDKVIAKRQEVMDNIGMIEQQALFGDADIRIGMQCHNPHECGFWDLCTENLPHPNVFDVRGRTAKSKKHEFYDKGIVTFADVYREAVGKRIKLSDKALRQVSAELEDQPPYIDMEKIQEVLDQFSFPLYFLDFETINQAIPPFDGTKPYQQIPFQYSLDIMESADAKLQHKEYLADPNTKWLPEIVEHLCNDIPMNVCTLAYNMAFEKSCIRILAGIFPDYAEHLLSIHDNMLDLMVPFRDQMYYTRSMEGSYSIKYVLPSLFPDDPSLNYHNLEDVHNGTEAMSTFYSMKDMNVDDYVKTRNNMLKYCGLDTFAMVKIWGKLTGNQIIREDGQ